MITQEEEKSINSSNSKTMKEIYKGLPDTGLRLIYLIEIIPNWETYLTVKQLEVTECYIKCLSAYEVDHQLKLNFGIAQQRLFGSSTSKGAIGRLEDVLKRLKEQGFYEKIKKNNINKETKKPSKPSRLTEETKSRVKQLLRLIAEMPMYEIHLTASQKERVFQFLRLRSIKSCAGYFKITETTFKQSLFGRDGTGGILGKLDDAYKKQTVNNWEDV